MTKQSLKKLIRRGRNLNKQEYQYLMAKSPHLFIQLCFAVARPNDYYTLENFHLKWITLIHNNREVEITAPRGFLKSTIIQYYLLYHTLFYPSLIQPSSLVVADSPAKAREFAEKTLIRALKAPNFTKLLGNIQYDYSSRDIAIDIKPQQWPWISETIQKPQEATIKLRGNTQEAPAGIHIQGGLLIFDDAAVSQTAKSILRQAKRRERIDDYRALAAGGVKTIHSDTRYTPSDYGIEVLEPSTWCVNNWDSRAAYINKEETKPLWKLKQEEVDHARTTMSETAWRLQYMNDVTALEGAIFKKEVIDNATIPVSYQDHEYDAIIIGVDMAYGGDDFTAATKAGLRDNTIYLLDYVADKYEDINTKYETIVKFANKYPIITEVNGPQKEVPQILQKYGAKVVIPYTPRGEKVERLRENLSRPLAAGELIISNHTIAKEFKNFTGYEHDDLLDAAFMAWYYIENHLKGTPYKVSSVRGLPRRRKDIKIPRRRGRR